MPGWHSCFQLNPASKHGKAGRSECSGFGESWLLPLPPSLRSGGPRRASSSPRGAQGRGCIPPPPTLDGGTGAGMTMPGRSDRTRERPLATAPPRAGKNISEAEEKQRRSPRARRSPRGEAVKGRAASARGKGGRRSATKKKPGFPSSPS